MNDSPVIDEILDAHRDAIEPNFDAYRGHVYRVYRYTLHQVADRGGDPNEHDLAVAIAAAFHDLGLFTEQTLDYLPPSIELADAYLEAAERPELKRAVAGMIDFHHKLTPYRGEDELVVEAFRRSDLVDVFAVPGMGVPMAVRRETREQYPMAGFRAFIARTVIVGALKHPLRPMPMLRW